MAIGKTQEYHQGMVKYLLLLYYLGFTIKSLAWN